MRQAVNPHDGVRLAWEEHGNRAGEPLLLVHGSALSKAVWRGMGYVKALGVDYRIITMDLRGHGRSDKPGQATDYEMERVLLDVQAVLDAAELPAAHYFGYSFGARIGFSLGVSAPERMLSFVSAAGTYRIFAGSIAELFFPDYDTALAAEGMRGFVAGWEARIGHPVDPVTRMAFMSNDPVALRAYFAQTEAGEGISEQDLADFSVPTLLLAGTLDTRRLADSRRAVELMPDARLLELPGRDHGDTLFPPAEVLAAVEPFLAAHN
ncbi:pimeloyl-ACP methyl ester carboxylesterase [Psychromicrobium silvestre]|uniref:Pimeloyl-ACP methyl ester carboxylesterase n=1 Tax=Psychromicrobium silvestre TaxID=1645614 RepID=A0A7Y9LW68_9MICC|nr:alpha/beta hydrolase [Psychromicrobium silvestre]NYE96729.1 pimeloyl-ACP methyl ester carboxylesterase [Psychromicrobium silvestre]